MTEIEKHALALVNAAAADFHVTPWESIDRRSFLEDVLCRAIEQHEAFRQEVSDAVEAHLGATANIERSIAQTNLRRFIIAKPDPLVEALGDADLCAMMGHTNADYAKDLRAALAARGLKIVEDSDD